MKDFSRLLEKLALTPSRNRKIELLAGYFRRTNDPDRGYALAILTDNLSFQNLKAAHLKHLAREHVDPYLFDLSYDYVGDLAETIALIWPYHESSEDLPSLTGLITQLDEIQKSALPDYVAGLLSNAQPHERWAIVKLATGGLRIGVSARLAKTALAFMSGQDLQEIEEIWHGLRPPYEALFAWLEGREEKPEIRHSDLFHPLMLSNPVDADKDFPDMNPADYQAEWKWDGIRVQLVLDGARKAMYSRTGDDISQSFPDVMEAAQGRGVLDGELLAGRDFSPSTFNDLQQRLNRKTVSKKSLVQYPAFVRVYDILFDEAEDLRRLPLSGRRARLESWFGKYPQERLDLSALLAFADWEELGEIRAAGADDYGHEGVMIKRRDSVYVPGRPKGLWYKWKRDPKLIDAVLMYAQRGHGKRSSFYSDYTFGVWSGDEIVPVGKAYFGFTDDELRELDKFVRNNTTARFGPVREVKKELVLEIAFDSAHESPRHKSGLALRFPRISRIRRDKPAREADTVERVRGFL